jgi:hypothetical protein
VGGPRPHTWKAAGRHTAGIAGGRSQVRVCMYITAGSHIGISGKLLRCAAATTAVANLCLDAAPMQMRCSCTPKQPRALDIKGEICQETFPGHQDSCQCHFSPTCCGRSTAECIASAPSRPCITVEACPLNIPCHILRMPHPHGAQDAGGHNRTTCAQHACQLALVCLRVVGSAEADHLKSGRAK